MRFFKLRKRQSKMNGDTQAQMLMKSKLLNRLWQLFTVKFLKNQLFGFLQSQESMCQETHSILSRLILEHLNPCNLLFGFCPFLLFIHCLQTMCQNITLIELINHFITIMFFHFFSIFSNLSVSIPIIYISANRIFSTTQTRCAASSDVMVICNKLCLQTLKSV